MNSVSNSHIKSKVKAKSRFNNGLISKNLKTELDFNEISEEDLLDGEEEEFEDDNDDELDSIDTDNNETEIDNEDGDDFNTISHDLLKRN